MAARVSVTACCCFYVDLSAAQSASEPWLRTPKDMSPSHSHNKGLEYSLWFLILAIVNCGCEQEKQTQGTGYEGLVLVEWSTDRLYKWVIITTIPAAYHEA